MERIRPLIPDLWVSVSATTRPPRPGEVDGISYLFMTDAQFDDLIANDGLLEYASVHGNRYGTPREPIRHQLAAGRQVILEIDPQGAFQVRAKSPDAILVFIEPPSFEELESRLHKRGTESEEQIRRRLATAHVEMQQEVEYDAVVQNADLDVAVRQLVEIIDSYADA